MYSIYVYLHTFQITSYGYFIYYSVIEILWSERMDPLSLLLQKLSVKGHIFFNGDFCGNFSVDTSGDGCAHFHVISDGECWLKVGDQLVDEPLQAGDLLLLPHDASHMLLPFHPDDKPEKLDLGFVSLICGHYEFSSKRANPILAALPEYILVRDRDNPDDHWLEILLNFLRYESQSNLPGMNMVMDHLSEVLFTYILRSFMNSADKDRLFLKAFTDPAITKALNLMHDAPQQNWTVELLSSQVGLSRTAFANKFHQLVGIAPAAYLVLYRMDLATELLEQGELSMDQIAEMCGYQSTAAFSKAYKKNTGDSPGKIRKK